MSRRRCARRRRARRARATPWVGLIATGTPAVQAERGAAPMRSRAGAPRSPRWSPGGSSPRPSAARARRSCCATRRAASARATRAPCSSWGRARPRSPWHARRVPRRAGSCAGPDVLVLAVLSGGASALLEVPVPGVALEELRALTAALLAAGADIAALNTVRRHCSLVKGGGLARAARRAAGLWALVLSDVVGDDPAVIASGPTVADPTTFAEALAVLERLPARSVPAAIRAHLERGAAGRAAETVKPGDPVLARTATVIVGGNRHAVEAAAAEARARGYATRVLARPFTGDAAEAGRHLAATILALPPSGGAALVGGGETTVRVVAGGRGGRCQHLALAAAVVLAGSDAVLLAAGTDGVDGPTDAAGACVDGGTVARACARGYDAAAALAATDSFPLLEATGDLVRSGPTGTNVADVVVALR